MVSLGGILVAVGWIINSNAETLGMLYLGATISGIGGGAVYSVCVGNAVKWFADRRGLAVGLTAAGLWCRRGTHGDSDAHGDRFGRV